MKKVINDKPKQVRKRKSMKTTNSTTVSGVLNSSDNFDEVYENNSLNLPKTLSSRSSGPCSSKDTSNLRILYNTMPEKCSRKDITRHRTKNQSKCSLAFFI